MDIERVSEKEREKIATNRKTECQGLAWLLTAVQNYARVEAITLSQLKKQSMFRELEYLLCIPNFSKKVKFGNLIAIDVTAFRVWWTRQDVSHWIPGQRTSNVNFRPRISLTTTKTTTGDVLFFIFSSSTLLRARTRLYGNEERKENTRIRITKWKSVFGARCVSTHVIHTRETKPVLTKSHFYREFLRLKNATRSVPDVCRRLSDICWMVKMIFDTVRLKSGGSRWTGEFDEFPPSVSGGVRAVIRNVVRGWERRRGWRDSTGRAVESRLPSFKCVSLRTGLTEFGVGGIKWYKVRNILGAAYSLEIFWEQRDENTPSGPSVLKSVVAIYDELLFTAVWYLKVRETLVVRSNL